MNKNLPSNTHCYRSQNGSESLQLNEYSCIFEGIFCKTLSGFYSIVQCKCNLDHLMPAILPGKFTCLLNRVYPLEHLCVGEKVAQVYFCRLSTSYRSCSVSLYSSRHIQCDLWAPGLADQAVCNVRYTETCQTNKTECTQHISCGPCKISAPFFVCGGRGRVLFLLFFGELLGKPVFFFFWGGGELPQNSPPGSLDYIVYICAS